MTSYLHNDNYRRYGRETANVHASSLPGKFPQNPATRDQSNAHTRAVNAAIRQHYNDPERTSDTTTTTPSEHLTATPESFAR